MPYQWMILLPKLATLVFVTMVGACVGSLINVLVYRLPRGINVVTPPSRCPSCNTRLTWRENIPVFGWLLLRGRCRFCKSKISPEYPLVEAATALLFGSIFALWYLVPNDAAWLGIAWGSIKPEWAMNDVRNDWPTETWPAMLVLLTLVGSLVAMTLVDAKTFTIPLVLAWVPAAVAVVAHPLHAAWWAFAHGEPVAMVGAGTWRTSQGETWLSAAGEVWTLATGGLDGWGFIGAGIGGVVGVGLSMLLLRLGLLRRSFADYDAWEKRAIEEEKEKRRAAGEPVPEADPGDPGADVPANVDLWIAYPHARREMVKEMAYLAPPAALAMLGAWAAKAIVAATAGPYTFNPATLAMEPPVPAPLWLVALGGVLMGYLIGGGIVWAVRILGSLAFGKEAMGLGDVHLMAAVGACLGWMDAVIGFFGAAFVGLGFAIAGRLVGGRLARAMPYGPYLAASTLIVIYAKPLVEWLLTLPGGGVFTVDLP